MADEPRWTLITGASSGIGAELAHAFAARGAPLVLTARRHERLKASAAALEKAHGVKVEVIPLDLEGPGAPQELHDTLDKQGMAVHTLVNNAGFGLRGSFASLPYERQIAMVSLNVVAMTALSRLMLPGMIERRRGGILNVSSTAAFQAGPGMAVYYASKAFVLSLSEALHEEAKPHGVTVTALCPGSTQTEFPAKVAFEDSRIYKATVMSAADVARAGIEGYEAGRAIVVPGAANRAGVLGVKFLSRSLARRVTGLIMKTGE